MHPRLVAVLVSSNRQPCNIGMQRPVDSHAAGLDAAIR